MNNHFATITAVNVNHSWELIQITLDNIEKLARVHLDVSKKILDNTTSAMEKAVYHDPAHDVWDFAKQAATATVERKINNYSDLYHAMRETKATIGKMVEAMVEANIQLSQDRLSRLHPATQQ